MTVRVSFAGREIMQVPEDLAEQLERLLDTLGFGGWRRTRAGEEVAIASPLEGRAIGLRAQAGDDAAAGIVARLRDRLTRAGALVREAPGDVCIAVRSRPAGTRARAGIRVLHGLRGFRGHRRLAAILAEHVAGPPAGDRPAISLSAGRWLGRWGGRDRPAVLVEVPSSGPDAPAFAEACVRGTYQALLRYFAAQDKVAGLPEVPQPPQPASMPVSRAAEPEVMEDGKAGGHQVGGPERARPAPAMPVRIIRSTGSSSPPSRFLPPGEGLAVNQPTLSDFPANTPAPGVATSLPRYLVGPRTKG